VIDASAAIPELKKVEKQKNNHYINTAFAFAFL
jgi:hypothetical protein